MGFIFYGGYYFLEEANQMTNEELSHLVSLDVDVNSIGNQVEISGVWNWNEVPQDGIVGHDYIGITLQNNLGEVITDSIIDAQLQLVFLNDIVYETAGVPSENGFIFEFPNEFLDQVVFGNEGNFQLLLEPQENEELQIIVSYLHTWKDHGGLISDDSRFLSPQFNNDMDEYYWVIERFETGKSN